jgi:hypothetical protein
MTNPDDDQGGSRTPSRNKWQDFAHTVRVVAASSISRHELSHRANATTAPRPVLRQFTVTLLAAAPSAGISLPMTEFLVDGGALGVLVDDRSIKDEIRVVLQLKGYAALQQSAGRDVHVLSDNGAIDCIVQFSDRGAAVCVLEDLDEVRDGLFNFTVSTLDDDHDAPSTDRTS